MAKNLEEFLKKTYYCDFSHPEIQKLAQKIADKFINPKDRAVAAFYWVRDNIFYRVGFWNKKASETLKEKIGTCTSKTNLLVALLRTLKIPAGYGVMRVDGQKYFGPILISALKKRQGKRSRHVYTYVHLNNRWIKCDPSDDKYFSQKTSYFNPTSQLVDWNGESDALLNLDVAHIFKDSGPHANIDNIMSKKPRKGKGILLNVGNLYIKFLRQNEQKIKNPSELQPLFKKWLRKNYPLHYYLFLFTSLFY